MTNPHGSFIWYELMSPDPDASKIFYDAVVGWDIEAQPAGEMDYRMITIPGGSNAGGVLRLTDAMQAEGAFPTWLGYVAVENVDATSASVVETGGRVWMAAQDMPGVGRIAMLADADGAPFYVMTPILPADREDAESDVFSVDLPMHVRWNELASANPEAAIAFYTRHFGWTQKGEMDMGEMGTYRFLQHAGVGIGALMPTIPPGSASRWLYYIGVDDIDRAITAIGEGGGTVLNGPHEIPGGEYSLHAIDPQRVMFGLVGPRKA